MAFPLQGRLEANLDTIQCNIWENLVTSPAPMCRKHGNAFWLLSLSAQHQQRYGLLVTRLTGPVNAESGLRTDTHLPDTVLVQRWWRSTLGGRVARRGHFQVTVGAAAPGVTFFGATWHSVSGWLLPEAVSEGPFCRCKVDFCAGLRIQKARRGPGSFCGSQRQSVIKRDKIYKHSDSSRLSNQNEPSLRSRDAPGVLLYACVSMCVETWTRIRCASPNLRRINAAFVDSRELRKPNLIWRMNLKNCNFLRLQLLKYDL